MGNRVSVAQIIATGRRVAVLVRNKTMVSVNKSRKFFTRKKTSNEIKDLFETEDKCKLLSYTKFSEHVLEQSHESMFRVEEKPHTSMSFNDRTSCLAFNKSKEI